MFENLKREVKMKFEFPDTSITKFSNEIANGNLETIIDSKLA